MKWQKCCKNVIKVIMYRYLRKKRLLIFGLRILVYVEMWRICETNVNIFIPWKCCQNMIKIIFLKKFKKIVTFGRHILSHEQIGEFLM